MKRYTAHGCVRALDSLSPLALAKTILRRVDRPSWGEAENAIRATVDQLLNLGNDTHIVLRSAATAAERLTMRLSTHVAQHNFLEFGRAVTISLVSSAIHLMKV